MKRILSIVCGAAVLYTALAHSHLLIHVLTMHHQDLAHPAYLASVMLAVLAEILCVVGGVLLIIAK